MRKSTSRALRISVTGVGVAALGMAFAGTASADDLGNGLVGGDSDNNSNNSDYGYGEDSESGTLGGLGGDGLGDLGGLDSLGSFGLPTSMRTDGDHELPGVSILSLEDLADNNGLPELGGREGGSGINTGLETPSLSGLKIIPFG